MATAPERSSYVDSYACENCFRRCVWIREPELAGPPRCLCGAPLDATPMPSGVYEIVDIAVPTESARPPRVEEEAKNANLGQEADIGYGKSHGYGPGHGGPTGPGDAPAGSE